MNRILMLLSCAVFSQGEAQFAQQGNKLVGSGSQGGSGIYQGQSVALSSDGNTAMVGGNMDNDGQGAVWLFTRNASIWSQQGNKLVGAGVSYAAY